MGGGTGGILIPGIRPRPIGAIWFIPGPPIPRTGPWRPGAAKAGPPGIGGITPDQREGRIMQVQAFKAEGLTASSCTTSTLCCGGCGTGRYSCNTDFLEIERELNAKNTSGLTTFRCRDRHQMLATRMTYLFWWWSFYGHRHEMFTAQ